MVAANGVHFQPSLNPMDLLVGRDLMAGVSHGVIRCEEKCTTQSTHACKNPISKLRK